MSPTSGFFDHTSRTPILIVHRKVYISFGGLLLYMEGPYRRLTPLRIDYVYLLIK